MRIALAVILVVVALGCLCPTEQTIANSHSWAIPGNEAGGARIENVTNNHSTTIQYESHESLVQKLQDEAQLKMWDSGYLRTQIEMIPAGGSITVWIDRPTIGSADTKWFTVVVKKGDEEITRESGSESVADYATLPGLPEETRWTNCMVVHICKPVAPPFDVYVIDDIEQKRYQYRIVAIDNTR